MARASAAPAATPDFDSQTGRLVEIAPKIARITAPNASAFTYTGTNSYLLGTEKLTVIDPGPKDSNHLTALIRAIAGRRVDAIILTHTHRDHCGLARALRRATGAPLRFAHPHRLFRPPTLIERLALPRACDFDLRPDRMIADAEEIVCDGLTLRAIATPGHCENHLAFGVVGTDCLFSGDHVMGWSTTVIAPPDGAMGPYLNSLRRVIDEPFERYLPGHGGAIENGREAARKLLAHREARNIAIVEGVAAGADTPAKLVRRIYTGLSPTLVLAARKTVEAHLDFLVETGSVGVRRNFGQRRFVPAG